MALMVHVLSGEALGTGYQCCYPTGAHRARFLPGGPGLLISVIKVVKGMKALSHRVPWKLGTEDRPQCVSVGSFCLKGVS